MKTLHLTLKKKWFLMIASGEKKEEYREIKPYWIMRLMSHYIVRGAFKNVNGTFKEYDNISANNGYSKNCPNIKWQHKGIRIGKPNPAWCEPEDVDKTLFILDIGDITPKTL